MATAPPISKDGAPNKGPVLTKKPAPAKPAAAEGLVPPDEQFWQRYSPHGEMGISSATSLILHVLILIFVVFGALLMPWWFNSGPTNVPVETVRLHVGGGGGQKYGQGDAPGIGQRDAAPEATEKTEEPKPPDPENREALDVPKNEKPPDNEPTRVVESNKATSVFDKLKNQGITAGYGRGGTGQGGGRGQGIGRGNGNGIGDGDGTLTNREKRMLRWGMIFDTRDGRDYLAQLNSIDAIIAIPMDPKGEKYKLIRDLSGKGPAKLLDEDPNKLQRIFWVDQRPESVRDMSRALGLKFVPKYFIAFLPEQLENKLFEMEKRRAGNHSEDEIDETKFRMERQGNSVVPVLQSISFKK
jgi:hypothetical protein